MTHPIDASPALDADQRDRWARRLRAAWLVASVILLAFYVHGAVRQAREVNTDLKATDQSAYMAYAKSLAESNYRFVGGRNRMPVYPLLQSLVYRPGLSDEAFFARGKLFNILLSVALLIGLWFLLDRYLPFVAAVQTILIVAFTVWVFKAGFFQTELLFYFVNFCLFLLLSRLLHQPTWQGGVLTGIVAGIAHLTKASVMAGLAIYVLVGALQSRRVFCQRYRDASAPRSQAWKRLASSLLVVACVVVFFLVTVSPYILVSKRVFGRYFYNVNSTFYIWYDSWAEAKEGTRAHGDRVGWPDMPPEEIPTMKKYLREHTARQILNRFLDGFRVTVRVASQAYGYFKYFCVYLGFCALVMAVHCRHTLSLFGKHFYLWLFGFVYFTAYIFLYAWYAPISFGTRLPLAQFLPLMFSLSFIIYRLYGTRLYIPYRKGRIALDKAFIALVSILLVYDLYAVLSSRILTVYGGE